MDYVNESGHPIATPQHRLAAIVLDGVFMFITCGIGWGIWSLVVWAQGQTPGKQILKIRVYDAANPQRRANWMRMFIRQGLIVGAMTLPIYVLWWSTYFFDGHVTPRALILHVSTGGTACMVILLILSAALRLADALWIFQSGTRRLTDHWAKTYVVNEAEILN